MKIGQYQEIEIKIVLFTEDDIIRTSDESADDLGHWNGDWFPKTDGNGQ